MVRKRDSLGVLAELERSLITERTRAGISAARKRGVKFGRKPKLNTEQLEHAREMLDLQGLGRLRLGDGSSCLVIALPTKESALEPSTAFGEP